MLLMDSERIGELTLEGMIEELEEVRRKRKRLDEVAYYLERAVVEGMEERGATVVITEGGTARITMSVSYDYGILASLREITSPDDLVGYTPERDVVKRKPEKWNLTQAKTLAKLSHQHRAILEDARIFGTPKIKFEARKGGKS